MQETRFHFYLVDNSYYKYIILCQNINLIINFNKECAFMTIVIILFDKCN